MDAVITKPDYSYKGLGKIYLAIHMAEKALVVRGGANKQIKADYSKTLPFSDVRAVRKFVINGFWVKSQGLELELNDLDIPFVRITMDPKDQKLWGSRLAQVCNLQYLA